MVDQVFRLDSRRPLPAAPRHLPSPARTKRRSRHARRHAGHPPGVGLRAITCRRATRPEYFAMGLIDQILCKDNDSRLYQALVQTHGLTGDVTGGINSGLGNMFDYEGPMLWSVSLFYDASQTAERSCAWSTPRSTGCRHGAGSKPRSWPARSSRSAPALYSTIAQFGIGRADLLAVFRAVRRRPARIDSLDASFPRVTPELVNARRNEYLRKTARTESRPSWRSPRRSERPMPRASH